MNHAVMPEGSSGDRSTVAARWGQALARLQEVSHKTNREVAAGLGYSQNNYSLIINGQVGPPSLERVLRALEYYGINPELFWVLIEAPAVEARQGVPEEIERQLAVAHSLAERALGMVREIRQGQS